MYVIWHVAAFVCGGGTVSLCHTVRANMSHYCDERPIGWLQYLHVTCYVALLRPHPNNEFYHQILCAYYAC